MSYYPYGVQQYSPIYQPQYQIQQQPTQQPSSGLSCKIVDSLEVSKIQEVPFGSFGVFPKGDLSEIYIKSWNGDGTTKIITYKPEVTNEVPQQDAYMVALDEIKRSIENLEEKIQPTASSSSRKRKEPVDE